MASTLGHSSEVSCGLGCFKGIVDAVHNLGRCALPAHTLNNEEQDGCAPRESSRSSTSPRASRAESQPFLIHLPRASVGSPGEVFSKARSKQKPGRPLMDPSARREGGRSLMEILGEDASESGGASIVTVYSFLNVWEIFFAARPCARPFAGAVRSCFSTTGRPFCIVPEDIERLRCFLSDMDILAREREERRGRHQASPRRPPPSLRDRKSSSKKRWESDTEPGSASDGQALEAKVEGPYCRRLEVEFVGRLMRAAPEQVVILALPFGVSNAILRSWMREGFLSEVVELHLMGTGGPSDAGLANIVMHCAKLRQLTVLCSSITAAAALVLHAQVRGELGTAWWKGVRFSRLCVLPRLQFALQPTLSIQRVPPWLCGEWIPLTPIWGFEVHHYDPLGRFVFLRNGGVERVGVVRSCVPSPFGQWWEIDICFFARQAWYEQLMLVCPTSGPSSTGEKTAVEGTFSWNAGGQEDDFEMDEELEAPSWVSLALGLDNFKPQGHLGTMRSVVLGASEEVRHRPRRFPHHSRRVGDWMRRSRDDSIKNVYPWNDREWSEAVLTSSAEGQDALMIFDHAESSEEEGIEEGPLSTMEELLEQLDRDEQPSRRAEEGSAIPSMEEMLTQLDVEEAAASAAELL